jgi:hypothetical protein
MHEDGTAIAALIRCTTLVPVWHSSAALRIPVPLSSAARVAASFYRGNLGPTDRLATLGDDERRNNPG